MAIRFQGVALMFTGELVLFWLKLMNILLNSFLFSGTVVDDPDRLILELDTLLTISDEDESSIRALNQRSKQILGKSETSYDFILTAQGGLKGTSKPIYYRVRL
jgi:hypothetical protein